MSPYSGLAVFDPSGQLVSHSRSFPLALPPPAIPRLVEAVRTLQSARRERQWLLLGGKRVLLQVLDGPQCGCVATVYEMQKGDSHAKQLLSPRQYEIAEYAAAGATASEISRILEISAHTVRQHLKEAYRRLQVGNRVELSHALESRGQPEQKASVPQLTHH
ncbi:MAG: helix-turn-helix transcriptional regulator [Myxococcales bacterium]|nr:helix-turn-helix transcriptional regulator [Myxococcales bacterium]MDH3485820.1 helix-turn-helix transcriptional regulator [Myxococcales bacterium]